MPEAKKSKRVKVFSIPDSYRGLKGIAEENLADAYAAQVQQAIDEFEAEGIKLAGILVSPGFANEGLLNVPKGFLEKATALVRKARGVLIVDEFQASFGRSGHHFWAHQKYNVTPNIVTMGKPMGNGYPLAGLVACPDMIETLTRSSMYFNTFAGGPVSCAVGMAVLDSLEQDNLLQNAITTSDYMIRGLKKLQRKYELIRDIRSLGMFFTVELVSEQQHKTPAPEQACYLVNQMQQRGVLISRIGIFNNILKLRLPCPSSLSTLTCYWNHLMRLYITCINRSFWHDESNNQAKKCLTASGKVSQNASTV